MRSPSSWSAHKGARRARINQLHGCAAPLRMLRERVWWARALGLQGRGAYYDASWTDPSNKPNWYCTDHAHPSVANIRIEVYPFADGRNSIAYIANKDIPGDTELRFTYGGPTPPAWNADKIKIDGRKRAPVTTDNIVHHKRAIHYKRTRE